MDATGSASNYSQVETPLVDGVVDGFVDFKGRPVVRSKSGGWRSAYFIIGNLNSHTITEIRYGSYSRIRSFCGSTQVLKWRRDLHTMELVQT